jgi:monovalent cation:H+ antiporter, CPA1 family
VGVIGALLHYGIALPWSSALLFGSMISATDPVSVLALFKKLGLPGRLTTIVEGESLLNDGTAVVVFRILLAIVIGTTAQPGAGLLLGSLREFGIVVFGGIAIGAIIGVLASTVTSYFDDHLLEITLTTIVAYGSFLLAEALHVSPVMAVLAAGLIVGNYGRKIGMSPTTQVAVNSFWEYSAFVVNSLVFLLIGLEIQLSSFTQYLVPVAWAVIAMLGARVAAVYCLIPLANRFTPPVPLRWQHILFWGGLRGSLSIALVLSLPRDVPGRPQLVVMIFGAVTFSLLAQGLTISPLLRWLKITRPEPVYDEYERLQARLMAETAAGAELERLRSQGMLTDEIYQSLHSRLSANHSNLRQEISALHEAVRPLEEHQLLRFQQHLIQVKKTRLKEVAQDGLLSEAALHALIEKLDEELSAWHAGSRIAKDEVRLPRSAQ